MLWTLGALLFACGSSDVPSVRTPPAPHGLNRDDNGVWLRRVWLHDDPMIAGREDTMVSALASGLAERGLRRVYPFLGPMSADGTPGWRDDAGNAHTYSPARAKQFFDLFHAAAPGVRVIPWTGGVLGRDAALDDHARLAGFQDQIAQLIALGADGVQLNVEPLRSYTPGFLELLAATKATLGPSKVLSVAAYPPPTPLHPFSDVHWTLPFSRDVCIAADEFVVMAYDTALTDRATYVELVRTWALELAATLPPPEQGGCEFLIGVPAYEDREAWHYPEAEPIDAAIEGVVLAYRGAPPSNFRGVAVYASWTTDASEWALYNRLWRERDAPLIPLPDFGSGS